MPADTKKLESQAIFLRGKMVNTPTKKDNNFIHITRQGCYLDDMMMKNITHLTVKSIYIKAFKELPVLEILETNFIYLKNSKQLHFALDVIHLKEFDIKFICFKQKCSKDGIKGTNNNDLHIKLCNTYLHTRILYYSQIKEV